MRVIIIGGDAAGMSAAMQIVRNSSNHEIITLEKGNTYSYAQCGLPYVIGEKVNSMEDVIARTPETFREKYGINAKTRHEVTKVDPDTKTVSGINLDKNEPFEYSYDKLLVASGVSPIIPPWKGVDLQGVFPLKTIDDARNIKQYIDDSIKKVTVIGGGYIGLEMAESFMELGKEVMLIERDQQLASIFDMDMAEMIHHEAEAKGINIKLSESVEELKGTEQVESLKTDKGEYQTDLVLIAVGIKPNTSFLKETGIVTSVNGAIQVNPYMQTNLNDIYAAGDCAIQYHRIKERADHIPLGTHANKQGQVAGLNMVDHHKTFKGVLGTSIIKFFDLTLARTGLNEKEASILHIPFKTVKIKTSDIAGYFPGNHEMTVKLVYHEQTYRILGGQIIGENGVDKRLDVLATALFHSMTTDDLLDLDLSYAPPYNSVWDPLQQAARKTN